MSQTDNDTITAVIVLYNTRLEESATYRTLNAALAASSSEGSLDIVVYDNSPVSQAAGTGVAPHISYVHDAQNGGVAKAYNHALNHARNRGSEWLLLLDQDSELPPDFLNNCRSDLRRQNDNPVVAAIVPTVYCGSALISPCKVGLGGKVYPVLVQSMQVPRYEITAINSGALVNVDFLDAIGGFNNEYWLDMLDHWLFRTVYGNKRSIAVGNNKLYHDLSIQDYSTISFARYKNIIMAESHFNLTDRTVAYKAMFRFRLFMRVLKLKYFHKRAELSVLTLSYVLKR